MGKKRNSRIVKFQARFKKCEACKSEGFNHFHEVVDLHHWRSQGAHGSDATWNLIPLCRRHHNEAHICGSVTFSNKYIEVHNWLIDNNWELDKVSKKWLHNH